MKEIPLTKGQVALVDDADFEALMLTKWCARWSPKSQCFYVTRSAGPVSLVISKNGKSYRRSAQMISMHRQLMNPSAALDVDHRNKNGLDNQRHNLRVCTRSQNLANRQKRRGKTSSRFKGVHPMGRGFMAQAGPRGTHRYLGTFDTEEQAARAYDTAARSRFGEFAQLNFT